MLNLKKLNQLSEVKNTNVFVQDNILDFNYYSTLLQSFPYDQMQRKDVHNKISFITSRIQKYLT
jgi:hypothetical protein